MAGAGGNGGGGAGGAGGISAGVVWKVTQPTLDTMTNTQISIATTGGTKGIGGNPGMNDGLTGIAQAVFPSP